MVLLPRGAPRCVVVLFLCFLECARASHYRHKTHTPVGGQIFVLVVLLASILGVVFVSTRGGRAHWEELMRRHRIQIAAWFPPSEERKVPGSTLGSNSPLTGWSPTQTSVLVWKAATEKKRNLRSVATYFGWPLSVYALGWLLYARFEAAYSSGELEQYLTPWAMLFVTQSATSAVVTEKALKLRESLRQMGVRELSYWIQFYVVELAFAAALALELGVVTGSLKLFHHAGAGYPRPNTVSTADQFGNIMALVFLFFCYNCAATAFAAFVSTFCASTATASLATFATAIAAIGSFIVIKMAQLGHDAWLLVPAINLNLAFLSMSSTHAVYPLAYRVSLWKACRYLLLDFVLYVLLAAYASEVMRTRHFITPLRALLDDGLLAFSSSKKRLRRAFFLSSWRRQQHRKDDDDDYLAVAPAEALTNPLRGGDTLEEDDDDDEKDDDTEVLRVDDLEAAAERRPPTVVIRKLRKTFPGGHVAVAGVDLDLYESEIVVLLGHNAAGKSTTLHMLTGLVEPDDVPGRRLTVYGRDFLGKKNFRSSTLGICPQHDVLWPLLTTREHVAFCAALRSGAIDPTNEEGDDLLRFFGLEKRASHRGHELSGGMRRKLSTACALAGNSKFVVLDEATAGVDALARRDFWGLLLDAKVGRTVLFVTHHLDEADALGDRVAILNAGVLECVGPPNELKRAYPYKLTCRLHRRPTSTPPALARRVSDGALLPDVIVQAAQDDVAMASFSAASSPEGTELATRSSSTGTVGDDDDTEHAALTAFVLDRCPGTEPYDDDDDKTCARFALPLDPSAAVDCVAELQKKDSEFHLASIGVATADLEDVFMRYGKKRREDTDDVKVLVEEDDDDDPGERRSSQQQQQGTFARTTDAWAAVATENSEAGTWERQSATIRALCRKRLLCASRDFKTIPLVLLPIGCTLTAFILNAQDEFGNRGSFPANAATAFIIIFAFMPTAGLVAEHVVHERTTKLRNVLTVAGCDSASYIAGTFIGDASLFAFVAVIFSTIAVVTGKVVKTFRDDDEVLKIRIPKDLGLLDDGDVKKGMHQALELGLEFLDDDVIPRVAGFVFGEDDDRWTSALLPFLTNATDDEFKAAENWITENTKYDVLDDDWRDVVIYDPDTSSIRRWAKGAVIWLAPVIFLVQLLFFSYALAQGRSFSGSRSAAIFVPMIALFLLFAPLAILIVMDLSLGRAGLGLIHLSKQAVFGTLFWGAAIFSPHGALFTACLHVAETTKSLQKVTTWYPPIAAILSIASFEAVGYAALCVFLDRRGAATAIPHVVYTDADHSEDDDDVRAETSAVLGADPREAALHVQGLRKVYAVSNRDLSRGKRGVVAVDHLSFRVLDGECFGLLGANGAGKSSTISAIMRSTLPSAGIAYVASFSILDRFPSAAAHLGVVTQHNTIYEQLTCAEHCELFAAIRGVPPEAIPATVSLALRELELDTPIIRSKLAGRLSGGQKRKLCASIAFIGAPRLCVLDEVSAGLDPASKRHLWTAIRRATKKRAVVLISHSIAESEALCTRLGIMAHGKLRAVGTAAHLKSKFVASSHLRLRSSNGADVAKLQAEAFPTAVDCGGPGFEQQQEGRRLLQGQDDHDDHHPEEGGGDRVMTTSDDTTPKARRRSRQEHLFRFEAAFDVASTFAALETARRDGVLEDYSIVEPTLEEVFLAVTKEAQALATTFVEDHDAEKDAAALIEDRTCCALDRRGHGLLVYGAGSLAAFAFVTMILFRLKPNIYAFIISFAIALLGCCARSFFLPPGAGQDDS